MRVTVLLVFTGGALLSLLLLQKAVDKLRADKADVVVILSHGGVNTADVTKGEDYDLAVHVNNVDVIVSGHTHTAFPAMTVVNPTTTKPVMGEA